MIVTKQYTPEQQAIVNEMEAEFKRATERFAPFHSFEEGIMVLREEIDELWDEVKAQQGERDKEKMRKEAIQVGAMSWRLYNDCLLHFRHETVSRVDLNHQYKFNSAHEGMGYIELTYEAIVNSFVRYSYTLHKGKPSYYTWYYAFDIIDQAIDFIICCCDNQANDEQHLEKQQ